MIYALHDSCPELKRKGAFVISKSDIRKYQDEGYGVHWVANSFNGSRKAENLIKINYWLADMDEGEKPNMLEKINSLPLIPSVVVETKRGYHCYWKAKDATPENYREIQSGIIKRLGSDPACKDVCRMLRMPNTLHLKDPSNPFTLKTVSKTDKEYTESQMLFVYNMPKPVYKKIEYKGDRSQLLDPENWEKFYKVSNFISEGRNNSFARVCLWLKDEGFDRNTVEQTLLNINTSLSKPLDVWEIRMIIRSKQW